MTAAPAPRQTSAATSTTPAKSEPATGLPGVRVCVVCEKPISGRIEKKTCSGRCRIALCRYRRHAAVLERLRVAEAALVAAGEAMAALRIAAELGPNGGTATIVLPPRV